MAAAGSAPSGTQARSKGARRAARRGAPRPLPPTPVPRLGRCPDPGTGAGRSAAPHPARAARRSRRRAHGTGLQAPRLDSPRRAHRPRYSRAAPAPLSRHPPPSALLPRPPPGGCPESAVARGWRQRGGPSTTSPPSPSWDGSRRPRARGGPLPAASPGSTGRRQSRAEATVTATSTATAETLQPGLRRAGAAPARHSAGGAAAPAPPLAPPRPAARAPRAPRAPAGSRARVPAAAPRPGRARAPARRPLGVRGARRRARLPRQERCFRGESRPEANLGRSWRSQGERRGRAGANPHARRA